MLRGQRLSWKWVILRYSQVPYGETSQWNLSIFGLVKKERVLSYEEFTSLPRVKVFSDVHCVTGWSKLDNLWEGVSTSVVSDLAEIDPEARFLMVHSADGFTTNLSLEDFLQEDALFALKCNGQPLTPEHGGPVRLVVPRLYFWKSAKWVVGLEFIAEDTPGYWESRGYHNRGDPWKEERYG